MTKIFFILITLTVSNVVTVAQNWYVHQSTTELSMGFSWLDDYAYIKNDISTIKNNVEILGSQHSYYSGPNTIDSTLVAYYSFTGNTNDSSFYNNHGANNGAVLTTDRFGNNNAAYLFDGLSSYISIPSSVSLKSPNTALTMSAWVNNFDAVLDAPVIVKSSGTANAFQYRMHVSKGSIYMALNNFSTGSVTSEGLMMTNDWHHVVATFQNNTASFYLDGQLVTQNLLNTTLTPDNLNLEIGRDTPGATEVFKGKIDEVRIYNVALSGTDIMDLYCADLSEVLHTIDTISACENYTWTNGVNYTSSNFVAQDTFPSAAGCDSIVTLNLTINYATSSTQNASSCGNYTWPVNGTNYTKSGSYEYYLTTTGGCDSLITLALIITQPNISIIEFTKEHNASFQGVQSSSIAFADVDSDGDLDVVLTGDSIVECGLYKIAKQYSNDGNGLFTEVIGSPFEGVGESSIAFADINGDGDQDLLITGTNTQHIKVAKLYSNNGKRIIPIVTAWE